MSDEDSNIDNNCDKSLVKINNVYESNEILNTNPVETGAFDDSKNRILLLEKSLMELELKNIKFNEENDSLLGSISDMKSDFRLKNDQLIKNFDDEKKDKESMVLKFAQSEQKFIELQRKVKELDIKLREKNAYVDQMYIEKEKLNKDLKVRTNDLSYCEKELSNLKISLTIVEQKLKNEESKFKDEVDRNKEMKKKCEELQRNILVLKEENYTLRANCQEIVKTYQDSEDMRSNSLSCSIKQIKEELKKCSDEKKELLDNFNKVQAELHSSKQTIVNQVHEIKTVKEKLKLTEADRICQEETNKQLKDVVKSLHFVKEQLNERISHLEPFEAQIGQLSQDRSRLTASNEQLKRTADEAESLVISLRQKESELVEFIQSLSNKNAELQAEKQESLKEIERNQLHTRRLEQMYKESFIRINFWEEKSKSEAKIWMEEKENFIQEIKNLKRDILVADQRLIDSEDQIYSLNKRHKAHTKDLARQLTKSSSMKSNQLNCQQNNTNSNRPCLEIKSSKNSTSDESQNSVFNLGETVSIKTGQTRTDSRRIAHDDTVSTNFNETPEIQMIQPQSQVLIEKVIRLQRLNAKLEDKIDFLSDHTAHLTQEIKNKSFLLKYLFSEIEDKVSVKSDSIDDNHFMMSKKGGIMASVYSSRQVDGSMTLELSLEISRRLQSVLEDTTIKNITLKESIDTLGEEISKLSEENRSLKKSMESS